MSVISILITVVVLSVVAVIANGLIKEHSSKPDFCKLLSEKAAFENNFTITDSLLSKDMKTYIAIDATQKKVALSQAPLFNIVELNYSDIFSVEVLEGGDSITKTSRTSQIGGAVLGGAMLGGAGAVIGGLSGKKTTSEQVASLALRIVINDISNPDWYIFLITSRTPKSSNDYKEAITKARKWDSMLKIAIAQTESQ